MKVIGRSDNGFDKKYICEIGHNEIEKFLNLYYNSLKTLEIGQEIDLSKGYNFARQTEAALKVTKEFIEKNQMVIQSILSGISIMGRQAEGAK